MAIAKRKDALGSVGCRNSSNWRSAMTIWKRVGIRQLGCRNRRPGKSRAAGYSIGNMKNFASGYAYPDAAARVPESPRRRSRAGRDALHSLEIPAQTAFTWRWRTPPQGDQGAPACPAAPANRSPIAAERLRPGGTAMHPNCTYPAKYDPDHHVCTTALNNKNVKSLCGNNRCKRHASSAATTPRCQRAQCISATGSTRTPRFVGEGRPGSIKSQIYVIAGACDSKGPRCSADATKARTRGKWRGQFQWPRRQSIPGSSLFAILRGVGPGPYEVQSVWQLSRSRWSRRGRPSLFAGPVSIRTGGASAVTSATKAGIS